MDHLVAVVLGHDKGDRQLLLGGGGELGRCHQEGAVAEEGDDARVRLRSGQAHADGGRDLVAHAGEAELEVAVPAICGVPDLQQVTGRAARGGDDRVAGPGVLLQQTDQLALGEHGVGVGDDVGGLRSQRVRVGGTVGIERRRTYRLPGVLRPLDLFPPGPHAGHVALGQLVGEGLEGQFRVAEDRRGAEPVGVARVEVDAGETHVRRGEERV